MAEQIIDFESKGPEMAPSAACGVESGERLSRDNDATLQAMNSGNTRIGTDAVINKGKNPVTVLKYKEEPTPKQSASSSEERPPKKTKSYQFCPLQGPKHLCDDNCPKVEVPKLDKPAPKERPGIRCSICKTRGHKAVDCPKKQHSKSDLVEKSLSDSAQKMLGERDAQVEALKSKLEAEMEKAEKTKKSKEKVDAVYDKINNITIRAPSGRVVEGWNVKPTDEHILRTLLRNHSLRLKYWLMLIPIYCVMILLFLMTVFYMDQMSYHEISWLLFNDVSFLGKLVIMWRLTFYPHYWLFSVLAEILGTISPFASVLVVVFHRAHAVAGIHVQILASILCVFYSLIGIAKIVVKFELISLEFDVRDKDDYTKMKHTNVINELQDSQHIYINNKRYLTILHNWISDYELNKAITWFYLVIDLFRIAFQLPIIVFVSLPLFIFTWMSTLEIPAEILETRDYYGDEIESMNVDYQPKLVRTYNIVRQIKIDHAHRSHIEFDGRADVMSLGDLKHIDPHYMMAHSRYELPPGVRIRFKNEYNERISMELFLQLTTPSIINLLDDEESVKFRLNRSSINFHGVNVDRFQHALGADVVNTTIDVVYHYYRNRKWAYCQSCPEELFYTLPKN